MEQDQSLLASFMPLMIAIIIACVSAFFIKNIAAQYPAASPDEHTVSGVGGWLLFLIVVLMFITPFVGGYNLHSEFRGAEYQTPSLIDAAEWSTYKVVTWLIFIPMVCLSFYAGACLLRIRDIVVVKRTVIILWIIGPAGNLLLGVLPPIRILGQPATSSQFSGIIVPIIFTVIWTVYLYKSKRVKATYGSST